MSSLTVREALVTALRSVLEPEVKVHVGRVPQKSSLPYVVVASTVAADTARLTDMQRETTRIYVYSDSPTDVELMTALETIRGALHGKRLTLDSGHLVGLRVRNITALSEVDEDAFTGLVTVEALHQ